MGEFTLADTHLILWPMAALAGLTAVVLALIPIFRIRDTLAGRAKARDFRLGETDAVPVRTRLINRNYMNLLELPILFYTVCLIIYVTGAQRPLHLCLAWLFVAFRILHTFVHIAINLVLLRLALFAASVICVTALWVITFMQISGFSV